ncbi:MAG: DNA topoisomerase [Phycisphaerales bacterium]
MAKKPRTKSPVSAEPAGTPGATGVKESGGRGGFGGRGGGARRKGGRTFKAYTPGAATGKDIVIVESPAKAKTINKYLGTGYYVLASIGHVRDLPSRNPKGVKSPVPGVDLKKKFKPTYEILPGKEHVIRDLKRAAKDSLESGGTIWFATDLDREGEAIAWHLAQELGITSRQAKRVIFPAITKEEIERAFKSPHPIDEDRVNAQQARRILDRIVGYQVSPLLWKKVARGLSAGRVQSVAVRLVVEREREIRAFIPDEFWEVHARFALGEADARKLGPQWAKLLAARDEKGNPPTVKVRNAWLGDHKAIEAELVEVGGEKFEVRVAGSSRKDWSDASAGDAAPRVVQVAVAAGAIGRPDVELKEDAKGKGPSRWLRTVSVEIDPATPYRIASIETKRTTTRPPPPYITSTLQQAASSRLGFGAQRTMRAAQNLYEGVDIPGEGPVGLITYMRTDSTHLAREAIEMVRAYIPKTFGKDYLPEKPNFFSSSNKAAQEAHEAIRPTSLNYPPSRVRSALTPDQFRLYEIIWQRFVGCQMTPAQWDSTAVAIVGGKDPKKPLTFRATGRVLVFDGFYRVSGVPKAADEQTLPPLQEKQPLAPFSLAVDQKFTQPPSRYSEASLIKMLESEGIGRPSTYAAIIQTIQDRKYVEQLERRFYSTDLGEVVTDKLIEAFPNILDVGYTREMERELDKVEEDHIDWVEMLERFYRPFTKDLEHALENLTHAKAETTPAPAEYKCPTCGSALVYRFGKNGRFLSCSTYPECSYASPVDREGRPRPAAETTNVACPKCGSAMTRRVGRFGPFLGCSRYGDKTNPCDGILNLDRKGFVVAPSPKPLLTDLPCPTCESPMNLRTGIRGPWLGCSRFPKCRGRGKWNDVQEAKRNELVAALEAHDKANPIKIIRTLDGKPLTDAKGKPLPDAPAIGQLADGATEWADAGENGAVEATSEDQD